MIFNSTTYILFAIIILLIIGLLIFILRYRRVNKEKNNIISDISFKFEITVKELQSEIKRQNFVIADYQEKYLHKQNNAVEEKVEIKFIKDDLVDNVEIKNVIFEKNQLEKEKQQFKDKTKKLWEQSISIHKEKERIEGLKKQIEKTHQQVTDSIRYAKYIQTAMLPLNDYLTEIMPEHFILFKPRDIVSGDFYWMKAIDDYLIIVAADCTGHGVPGAFVSMLGVAFLNEVVGKIFEHSAFITAAEILNQLRKNILQSLNQVSTDTLLSDGMDMALIIIDKENSELQFAGAYNPLILIRNKELTMIKADKMPVGISPKMDIPFTNHVIPIHSGDNLYMYSDGYIDQFGGGGNRKYKSLPFKKLLTDNSDLPMKKQLAALEEEHLAWKGSEQQVDDILVIGIRI